MGERDLAERLIRIETKLDAHMTYLESWKSETADDVADLEARMRAVERWKYSIPATVITAVVALLLSVLP